MTALYTIRLKKTKDAKVIMGGKYDDKIGYFIQPTVILTTNPKYETMCTELFGPILTIYVYPDNDWKSVLELI
ncbi:MAG: aldehyde dehydrogenase family protein [Flavobacteriaceae bacterium]|nr:aldehyde dehydrogenase family protein [Flavobacteriaceae bacterium]